MDDARPLAVLLGTEIGRVVPFLLTAPISGFAALAALIYLQVQADHEYVLDDMRTSALSVLSPTIQDLHEAFTTVAPQVNLLQALWFTAIAVTGLALSVAAGRRAKLIALVPAVVGAAIALPLMPTSRAEAYVPDTDAVALVCTPGLATDLCVTRAPGQARPDRRSRASRAGGPGRQTQRCAQRAARDHALDQHAWACAAAARSRDVQPGRPRLRQGCAARGDPRPGLLV